MSVCKIGRGVRGTGCYIVTAATMQDAQRGDTVSPLRLRYDSQSVML